MKTKTIQITAGTGPAECCWVVAQVLKHMVSDLKQSKLSYLILERTKGPENGTLQSATLRIEGKNLDELLAPWLGTIKWIGTSSFRKLHKRKNWFVGVNLLETNTPLQIELKDVKFQAIRSSGPGGQHANKVSSAVRATHLQTGISVLVMDSRSQHQNKKLALQRLQQKVAEYNLQQLSKAVQDQWKKHSQLERGSPVRVFKGNDFKAQQQQKNYKKQRQKLKNDLNKKQWD